MSRRIPSFLMPSVWKTIVSTSPERPKLTIPSSQTGGFPSRLRQSRFSSCV